MSTSLFLRGLLGFFGFAGVFLLTRNLPIALAASALVWIAVFWLHDWPRTSPHHGPLSPWEPSAVWSAARRSTPVGLAVFINGFNIRWDRRDYVGFVTTIANSTAALACLCLAGIAVSWLAGPLLLAVVYGPEFAEYADLLVMVAIGGSVLLIGNFLGYAMMATKTFTLQLLLNIFALASVLIASAIFIPAHGLCGAVEAILVLGVVKVFTVAFNACYVYMNR